ncbi:MAG: Gfo/Idh/MocA family oxidoreductase [Clostridiales bacterium]|nr:Gfo/Idh/MocA family oxidoreductase [Clostridiales bacterium]MDU3239864.1 Gfo/Idh/MocA family oxidoreductase [Clostridiales bacterium]
MKMGILGAGNIGGAMARTIAGMDKVEAYAVGARDLARAEAFAAQYHFTKAFGSYEEMLSDPELELVYVATPHSHHYEHVKLCLEHGKHVLCEKAFTVNAKQAVELFEMAKSKNLLLTEAIWTRYMPMRKTLDEIAASGVIGEITSLTANLGYVVGHLPRMQEPGLAGGALLDLGVYPINFASMVFGDKIREVSSSAVLTESKVDAVNSITLIYEDGKMAQLHSNMMAATDRRGMIYGDKGYIEVQNINNCEGIRVFDTSHQLIAEYETPKQITGYEYEVEACMEAMAKGELECPQMPHKESIRIMELMDSLRAQWGVKYPNE